MAAVFCKVYHINNNGVETDITEQGILQNKRGLQIKDAKTDLNIRNSKYRYKEAGETIFAEDNTVEVYADYVPITRTSSQLLISGQIQELTQSIGENGTTTKLSVSDKTSLLLSGIWGFTYEGQTVDTIIRSVINNAPSAENTITTNNVATSTTSGSAFPSIDMAKVMKPIYEWLTDLSQPEITGEDKAYLFYVDKDNDVHWFYPTSTVSSSLIEGNFELYNASMKKSQDNLVNLIIYNAGQDLTGDGILWYKYNSSSKSNKLRMKFQPMIDVGRDLFKLEILAGNLTESTGGPLRYQGKDYVATYPLTPSWPGATSVANQTEYDDAFRTQCKVICDGKAQSYMQAFSGLRWKGKIEMKGNNNYVAGDLLFVNLPTLGILNQNLRVWDVQHSIGPNGWITGLELREDDEAITSE